MLHVYRNVASVRKVCGRIVAIIYIYVTSGAEAPKLDYGCEVWIIKGMKIGMGSNGTLVKLNHESVSIEAECSALYIADGVSTHRRVSPALPPSAM